MYAGRIVEAGPGARHLPQAAASVHAGAAGVDSRRRRRQPPARHRRRRAEPRALPPGCTFAPRCPYRMEVCTTAVPALVEIEPGHAVRCYLHSDKAETVRHDHRANAPTPLMALVEVRHLVKHFERGGGLLRAEVRRPRGGRCQLQHRGGRDLRPGRRIRQRQEHDRPLHAAAHRADVGRDALPRRERARLRSRRGCARRGATCRWSFRIRTRRSTRACAPATSSRSRSIIHRHRHARRAARRGGRAVPAGRPRSGAPRALSARVQRRPAPAHRPGARARAQPVVHHRRRAGLRARRVDSGAGDQPAARPAGAAQADLSVHRARSAAGAPHLHAASR